MGDGGDGAALLPVEEIVPPRSVLTELARGFLLTREGDGRRATRFATTFLQEQQARGLTGRRDVAALPSPGSITFARRFLGRLPHGAVERPSARP